MIDGDANSHRVLTMINTAPPMTPASLALGSLRYESVGKDMIIVEDLL